MRGARCTDSVFCAPEGDVTPHAEHLNGSTIVSTAVSSARQCRTVHKPVDGGGRPSSAPPAAAAAAARNPARVVSGRMPPAPRNRRISSSGTAATRGMGSCRSQIESNARDTAPHEGHWVHVFICPANKSRGNESHRDASYRHHASPTSASLAARGSLNSR